jgi:hypothetical protein
VLFIFNCVGASDKGQVFPQVSMNGSPSNPNKQSDVVNLYRASQRAGSSA